MRYILIIVSVCLFSCGNTYYIVRHAEKAPVERGASQLMASDPPLSEAGRARAQALQVELSGKKIRHVFSTNFKRTTATAEPVIAYFDRTRIEYYSSKKDSMDLFIQQLKSIKKGNILVVGHSNTVDDIANKLCGSTVVPGDLKDNQYDNLFVVRRKGNRYIFTGEKYGVPTE